MQTRHEGAQSRLPAPYASDQQREECPDQPDMKSGDGDQMAEPGRAQRCPCHIVQPAGISERERPQVRRRGVADTLGDALRHPFAPRIHALRRRDLACGCRHAHIARRSDALRQCLALGIEASGIAQAAWRTQLEPQLPTRTCM
ncbi:hypothetical protein FHY31_002895 [Xanthomonas euvesicatoria]|uniref:Uncharacterized protein n=1 Tax=Xanthomonas euvesicatoria TaxID=456327 RepID=A0AAW3U675_XANEU|nr:hypothetical protein [Xanthomonas euvesicatoria]MBB4871119.1 hypothetical protein [Xanthomonas euvesicatoria]